MREFEREKQVRRAHITGRKRAQLCFEHLGIQDPVGMWLSKHGAAIDGRPLRDKVVYLPVQGHVRVKLRQIEKPDCRLLS